MNDMASSARDALGILLAAIVDTQPALAAELRGRQLKADTRLADLGINSIALYEIAGYIEDYLDATLPTEDLLRVRTVGDVTSMVEQLPA